MKTTTMKHPMILLATLAFAATACGGGKDEEESGPAGSLADISGAIESPTGTVSAATAGDVARAFEETAGVPTGGNREGARIVAAAETNVPCNVSGDISVEADGSGEFSSFSYNSCCQTAGCCLDGTGTVFVDTSGSGAYSTCADYDIDYACEGLNATYSFQYCAGTDGTLTYAIEVEGDTFAVSGSVSNGNGTLTITGENGTWTCTYTDYSGSCTGDGAEFSF